VLYQQFSTYSPFPRSLAAGVAATVCGLGILGFVLVALHQ
jgi:hypothetical protein